MATRLVVGAQRFNFEADGRRIVGATVSILEPRPKDADGNRVGYQVLTVPATMEVFLEVSRQSLPGYFRSQEGVKANAKGRAELVVESMDFVGSLELGVEVGL